MTSFAQMTRDRADRGSSGDPSGSPPRERGGPPAPAGRWWGILLAAGVITVLIHVRLARIAGPHPDVERVLVYFGFLFAVYLAALPAARRLDAAGRGRALLWIFAVGAVSLGAYLTSPLRLSGEVDRYRWDGEVARRGYNPYQVTPDDPDLVAIRTQFPVEIAHGERRPPYPPLAEYFFYGMARLGLDSVFWYRVVFSAAALLCALVFLPLCRAAGVPATRVAVFLWHPLLILETGANAHIETLPLFFLLVSLFLLVRRHQITPTASLAVATLLRTYPIALLPLYFRRVPPYRLVLYAVILGLGSVPFLGAGREIVGGLVEFLRVGRLNPGPYLAVEWLFRMLGRPEWTRAAVALAGGAIAVILYLTDDGTPRSILTRAFYLAVPPLVLGPVVAPWYLVWLLPFLALTSRTNPLRMAMLYLSGSVILGYLTIPWGTLPAWVTWLEFGPAALLALRGFLGFRRPIRAGTASPAAS
jgi:alpha-1,6-mannosyltransferase